MKQKLGALLQVLFFGAASGSGFGQVTANDGDWTAKFQILENTPEAEMVVRVGDIDNLGFGWPAGFDPFTGATTPAHGYPWTANPEDPDGTDRIMVITSYEGSPPAGRDGYTSGTSRPENSVRPIVIDFTPPVAPILSATLQIFVDDFQAPLWQADYEVTLNGHVFEDLEIVINELNQTGPVGKLVTVQVPLSLLPEVESGHLELRFDDFTTGAGDGYAIDFIKLLINRVALAQTGTISGTIMDATTGFPIAGATVSTFDLEVLSESDGSYVLENVPAGLARVVATATGYESAADIFDVTAGETVSGSNLQLEPAPFSLNIYLAVELEFFARADRTYELQYSGDLENWFSDEEITGDGLTAIRFRPTRHVEQRYWQVVER